MFEFNSDRSFLVVRYADAHGPLLLANLPNDQYKSLTKIEVLFKDVRSLELRVFINSLTIREIDIANVRPHASNPQNAVEPGLKFYSRQSSGWSGYILAGAVFVHEHKFEPGQFDAKLQSHFWQAFETPEEYEERRKRESLLEK